MTRSNAAPNQIALLLHWSCTNVLYYRDITHIMDPMISVLMSLINTITLLKYFNQLRYTSQLNTLFKWLLLKLVNKLIMNEDWLKLELSVKRVINGVNANQF